MPPVQSRHTKAHRAIGERESSAVRATVSLAAARAGLAAGPIFGIARPDSATSIVNPHTLSRRFQGRSRPRHGANRRRAAARSRGDPTDAHSRRSSVSHVSAIDRMHGALLPRNALFGACRSVCPDPARVRCNALPRSAVDTLALQGVTVTAPEPKMTWLGPVAGITTHTKQSGNPDGGGVAPSPPRPPTGVARCPLLCCA